jgi:hypothetical protein
MKRFAIPVVCIILLVCAPLALHAAEVSDKNLIFSPLMDEAAAASECVDLYAQQEPLHERPFRKNFGFEVSTGIQGILSFVQLGVLFPLVGDSLFIDLKLKYLSSITWATYIDTEGNAVSFHPAVIGGAVSFGGYSPLFYDCVRMYGGVDLFIGHSFTPYDSWFRQTGNLIGDNLTYAALGFFGLEFFTSPHMSIILDAGGGFKSLFGDKNNQYAIASGWLGSGFGIKMGVRYYL